MDRLSTPPNDKFLTLSWEQKRVHMLARIIRGQQANGAIPENVTKVPKKLIKYATW